MKWIVVAAIVQLFCVQCFGYYLPGVAPRQYLDGEDVPLKVIKLTSVHTQLPYKYYSLAFCKPEEVTDDPENLGEILKGDRIENSLYKITAGVDSICSVVCDTTLDADELKDFNEKVELEYRVHWSLDGLPAAVPKTINGEAETIYDIGFPLGMKGNPDEESNTKAGVNYINNHVDIKILYHVNEAAFSGRRIIAFLVEPASIKHNEYTGAYPSTCVQRDNTPYQALVASKEGKLKITWTYSVTWEETDTPWANRWDKYLFNSDPQIHWFSIINSLMIVLFLTGMVAMIMMRTLHADFRRYNQMDPNEEAEETGWKLVHGDVFRPPNHPMLLSVLVGSGVQVLGMTIITMMFAVLGFLSPANRGGLTTAGIVLFVVMGVFAGYSSTRNYKMLKGQAWKKNTIMTAFFFPGVIFGIFFILNFFIWAKKSSAAVPFTTMLSIVALWFCISVPLAFFGSYFAYKKPAIEHPVRTNQIPREVPPQLWYMSPVFSVLMGGILPFGAVFIELFFILSAIWGNQVYYIFGFLFIVFVILVLTCAEITIVMCYFQLCSEDYHWWWRSYLTSGASAFYMFLYSIFYFATRLEINTFVSVLVYFGYTLIMAAAFFVLTGTIGYYACFMFVRKIYSQVKVD